MSLAKHYIKERGVQAAENGETVSRGVDTCDGSGETGTHGPLLDCPRVVIFGSGPGSVTVAREHALAGHYVRLYRNLTLPQLSSVSRPDLYTTANFDKFDIDEEVLDFRSQSVNSVLNRFRDMYDLFYIDGGSSLTAVSGSLKSPKLPIIYTTSSFKRAYPHKNTGKLQGSVVIVLGNDSTSLHTAKWARDLGAAVSIISGKHPHNPVREHGINFGILHPPYSIGEKDLVAFIRSDRTEDVADTAAPLFYYCDILIMGPAPESLTAYDQRLIGTDSTYVQRDTLVDPTLTLTGQCRWATQHYK
ncbi:Hypothetical protein GLP15_1038 [Giardia lamblia P15]|uniref:Uncharacterized protein n=1 Tax=Giardia intestinalis (strain P15) TaxID=658858 RepID=E1F2Z6_GIAIA|nr:Hypothetical protein GLP15_1038 [Giardia lamblia P15]